MEDKIPEIILYSHSDFYDAFLKGSEESSSEENQENSSGEDLSGEDSNGENQENSSEENENKEELTDPQKKAIKKALYNGENFNFLTDKILHLTLPRGPKGEPAVFAQELSVQDIIFDYDEKQDSKVT
jgi:hypothetical protein